MSIYYDRDLQPMDDFSSGKTQWGGHRVLQTEVSGFRVSTVWLSVDHGFGGHSPIVFESMIWGPDDEECECVRHLTEEQAARWHLRALDAIRAGAIPSYENDTWMEDA